jgi:hypothetical protein
MRSDTRINIEPADNGYIVTYDTENKTELRIFPRRRQLMHYIGKLVDQLEILRKTDAEELDNE